jgi:hypothetical protein
VARARSYYLNLDLVWTGVELHLSRLLQTAQHLHLHNTISLAVALAAVYLPIGGGGIWADYYFGEKQEKEKEQKADYERTSKIKNR